IFLTRQPLFGRQYPVFVTMPSLGKKKFILNLTVDTNDYFIDEVVTNPGTRKSEWYYTNNLARELRKLKLKDKRFPYKSCYLYRTRASFYKSDHKFVIARISSYSDRRKLLAAEVHREIRVRKPPEAACLPIFSLRFCEDPDYPLAYRSTSYLHFMAVVTGDCADIRYEQTRWDIYDLREKSKGCHITSVTIFRKRPVIRLPENALRNGSRYMFILTVSSSESPGHNQTARQLLLAVSNNTITPDIECIRNCAYGVYAPANSVHLRAECQDCKEPIVRYEWWVRTSKETSKVTLLSKTKSVIIPYRDYKLFIRLKVKLKSKLWGEAFFRLRRNDGPKNGNCTVSPYSGIEAVTTFRISCRGFQTQFEPLFYRYENPSTGIIGQSQYARYETYLTQTEELTVFICDAIDICARQILNVDVQPFKFKDPRAEPEQRIREILHNVTDMLKRGFWSNAFSQSLVAASHARSAEDGHIIFDDLIKMEVVSVDQLERFAFMTSKLVTSLIPLDYKDARLLAQIFKKMSRIFVVLLSKGDHLNPSAYFKLTAIHVLLMSAMSVHSEAHSKGMCSQYDAACLNVGRKRLANLLSIGFDPLILVRINQWMLASWHLYKCVYFLAMLASQQQAPYDNKLSLQWGDILYEMNKAQITQSIETLTMKSRYRNHELKLSPYVLNELRTKLNDKEVLLQFISQTKNHNMWWWLPYPMPAMTNIIIIHAFSRKGYLWFGSKSRLDNPLEIKSNISEFTMDTTYNKLATSASILNRAEVRYYSIMLEYKAMLAVRLINCSEPFHIHVRLHRQPAPHELIKHPWLVTPEMKGKRVWLANGCKHSPAVVTVFRQGFYEALYTKGAKKAVRPLNYSIMMEIHQCGHYRNRTIGSGWSDDYCNTSFEYNYGTSIHCTCHTLGVLATRIFPILPQEYVKLATAVVLTFQWLIFAILLLMFLLLGSIMILSFGNIAANQKIISNVECKLGKLKVDPARNVKEEEILLVIVTGGQEFAGTTSNVNIYLKSPFKPQNVYQITQDPGHPRLLRSTTNMMQVSRGYVTIPTRLALGIEKNGRYPSWYCRTITVIDMEMKRHQLFEVERWITPATTPFMRSRYFHMEGQASRRDYTWCKRFRHRLEELYVCWFCEYPFKGPWQTSIGGWTLTRVERASVIVSKMAVTITLVCLYYGRS
ncbi:hypothetical protein KR054_006333, partial [Drosophila jambulina]